MGLVQFKSRTSDQAPRRPPGGRRWLRRALAVAREPLLHFLVVGLLIFVAAQAWRTTHDTRRIVITPDRVADLATKYRMQFGTPPTRAQLDRLVDAYVDEEVLYREGVAQGLDRDDEIVRRRIAQKTQFLQADAPPPEPSESQLKVFFEGHAADYGVPARYSFSHLYFSPDKGGDRNAETRAREALGLLQGAAPDAVKADAFPDLNSYSAMGASEAARVFGDTALVAALPTAPIGRWSGPFRSAYGWHLLRVDAATPARTPAYADLKDRVRADYFANAHDRATARAMAAARARYTVVRADLKPPAS